MDIRGFGAMSESVRTVTGLRSSSDKTNGSPAPTVDNLIPESGPLSDLKEDISQWADRRSSGVKVLLKTLGVEESDSEIKRDEESDDTSATSKNSPPPHEGEPPESISLQVSATRTENAEIVAEETVSDPLMFDLDGNGSISTTGVDAGLNFDIDGDGTAEKSSFVGGNDAILAYDKNGNGVLDSGRELFGDQNGAANGYAELSIYDSNADGRIDSTDPIFDKLRLVKNRGADTFDMSNAQSLRDVGISSIDLTYRNVAGETGAGDKVAQAGSYTRTDGSEGATCDILLKNR